MKKSRFNEARFIGVLREQEAGSPMGEVCRRYGAASRSFIAWGAKNSGMSVSDALNPKTLEHENRRLKKKLGCSEDLTAGGIPGVG